MSEGLPRFTPCSSSTFYMPITASSTVDHRLSQQSANSTAAAWQSANSTATAWPSANSCATWQTSWQSVNSTAAACQSANSSAAACRQQPAKTKPYVPTSQRYVLPEQNAHNERDSVWCRNYPAPNS